MKIRKATIKDLDFLVTSETANFPLPWRRSHFEYELTENPYSHILILEVKEEPIGYIDFWITFEVGQINKIAIIDVYKKQGYATYLLHETLQIMIQNGVETSTLEVRVSNTPAYQFYLKHGYRVITRKAKYYEDGEDAYAMMKVLL